MTFQTLQINGPIQGGNGRDELPKGGLMENLVKRGGTRSLGVAKELKLSVKDFFSVLS